MADKDVASLTAASALTGAELVHVVQGGNSRKATVLQLAWTKNLDALQGMMNPRSGTAFTNGFVGLRPLIVPFDMTALGVRFRAVSAAPTAVFEPVVYGSNAAGDVSTRLANGSSIIGASQGVNTAPFSSGLSLIAGQLVWVGLNLQTATISMATQQSALSAHFTQGSIPAPSSPGALTYATQGWASPWIYGTA